MNGSSNYGFIKVAAATPRVTVADCAANAAAITQLIEQAAGEGVKVLCLPELCLTGATCGDLFRQSALLNAAGKALLTVAEATAGKDMLVCVGLPVSLRGRIYNCAALLFEGEVKALVPKKQPAGYAERCFAPAPAEGDSVSLGGSLLWFTPNGAMEHLPMGPEGTAFPGLRVAVLQEGEADAEATLLLRPFAAPELVGAAARRREEVCARSRALRAAVVAAGAGVGESTTDFVFSGHCLIAENGALLAENAPFAGGLVTADADIERLLHERQASPLSAPAPQPEPACYFQFQSVENRFARPVPPSPFVPEDPAEREERCAAILAIQAVGLQRRLEHTRCQCPVLGISGGLDSTLALLVTARAADRMGLAREKILAVTMPGFGTTVRTRSNAEILCERLGVSFMTVPITEAVGVHFRDIGQDPAKYDVTFENAQARERTQILMDLANQRGGLVVGTGDLSELALGWATYNGDHMSMYDVNGGVPKTLVRCLVAYEAAHTEDAALAEALRGILDTPVSPELLPPENGDISQKTENIVGPYELHDFFLYYLLRWGFGPKKLLFLAERAFAGQYGPEVIRGWLRVFLRRFFAQQFKRSCLSDGPAVGSVGLSPRGGWSMPSDAAVAAWLAEVEENR